MKTKPRSRPASSSVRPTMNLQQAVAAAKSAIRNIHRDYIDDQERAGIERLIEHAERTLYGR